MSNPPLTELVLLRAFEGALREGRLLDESLQGILDAALNYFDAAAVALLPAGGAPPMTRSGRSIVAAAAEQRLTRHLEEILLQGREARVTDSGLTFLGVPVKVGEQVRAAFGLATGSVRGRATEHDEAARLFGRSAAHVLERDRTLATLMKRREEAVALFELASGALHSLNVDDVIRLTVASLARELDFEQVRAFRFDADTREIDEILSHGPPSLAGTPAGSVRRLLDDEEILARCLSEHGPAFEDESGGARVAGPIRRRRMALPLQAGETVFGFLLMARRGAFVLTPQEMRLAQELSRLAAGALEKARLMDVERRASERVAFVARIHAALSGLTEVDAILQRTVKEVGEHFDADLCAIRLLPTGELPGASAIRLRSGSPGPRPAEEIPDALLSHLSAEGSHVLLADASSDASGLGLIPAPELVKNLPRPMSLLAVPLAYRDAIVGVLAAVTGGRPHGFGVAALDAFETVATEVSLAVTSARLLEKERDSYRFLVRLREVGRTLATTFDAARIKQTLCEQAVTLLKADASHFWDADPQAKALQVTARWGVDVGGEPGRTIPTEQVSHPLVRAFLDKGLLLVDADEASQLFGTAIEKGSPVVKAAIVPLVYQDERIGVLSLALRRGTAEWPPDLAGRLSLLADSGAIALHNARMMRIIEQQTERDSQTGLYNRASIFRRLESEVRRAERNGQSIAVGHLRVEGLVEAMQRLGASFGDVILPKAAAQLVRATRSVNVVGHDRGDRFWILVFDANKAQAHRAMEAIQKNFAATPVDPRLEPAGVRLELTAGLAAYPEDAFDASSLALRAEEALDDAVKAGPRSIVLYGVLSGAEEGL